MQPASSHALPRIAVRDGIGLSGLREVAEETAIALTYNGTTHAVLMATPADLEDFAIGFSINERIVADHRGIAALAVVHHADGIEVRMRLALGRGRGDRRRSVVSGSACGLCGVTSLAEAVRAPHRVDSTLVVTGTELAEAVAAMRGQQLLGQTTRAVHAAGFWTRAGGLAAVREDVGRHNALDKLAGAIAQEGLDASAGIVVLTSRVSVEMVQKTARIGAPVLAAVSAPTALAIRVANAAGITLAAIVRDDGFELFTSSHRIIL